MPRTLPVTWDITTGALTFDRQVYNYVKRGEDLRLSVKVEADGVSAVIPGNAAATIKPVNNYTTVLTRWDSFSQVGTTNVYISDVTLNLSLIHI